MIDLALELKEAIKRYAQLDQRFPHCPTAKDWDNLSAQHECLKVFYDATLKLSGTAYPTLNLFFPKFSEVYLMLKKMVVSPFPFIVKMGKIMCAKWNKYWEVGSAILAIAAILDPRCKVFVVQYYFELMHPEESERFVANLRICLHDLFKEYSDKYSNEMQAGSSSQPPRSRYGK